jgi:anti-anti-sigma factor
MPVEKWSESVVVVHLANDPQFTDDLESLEERLAQGRVDAVLDFHAVGYINSSNIARLLKVRKQMVSADARLVLCSVNTQIWSAFLITGLDKVFEFSDSVSTALATLQMAG